MFYYTSDLHFGCQEIFDRTERGRQFSDLDEMRYKIIEGINARVKSEDTLYILGDVSCAGYDPTDDLKNINCAKILIKGNHDAKWVKHRRFRNQFKDIASIKAVHDADTRIVLCHYPLAEWDGYWKGHYHFYGHVHNSTTGGAAYMKNVQRAVNTYCLQSKNYVFTAKELIEQR